MWPFSKKAAEAPPTVSGRRIIVPVDDSDHSKAALEWAVKNVIANNDLLHLVSVAPPVAGPYTAEAIESDIPGPTKSQVEEWKHELHEVESDAQQLLQACEARALALGVPRSQLAATTLAPTAGSGASGVGASLLDFSTKEDASLVVLGSRGMGGMKRSLMNIIGLGSVSDYMLQHAKCPVVVVKGDGQTPAAPSSGSRDAAGGSSGKS